jgi:hypothetical protein
MQPMVPVVSAIGKPLMPTTHRRCTQARGCTTQRETLDGAHAEGYHNAIRKVGSAAVATGDA